MKDILVAFGRASRSLMRRDIFWHLLWPGLLAVVIWAVVAFMLWTLFHHGLLRRICAWAGTWSQVAIAKSLLEGLRLFGGADPGFKVGQLRFVT